MTVRSLHGAVVGGVLALAAAPAGAAPPSCLTPVADDGHEPLCNPFTGSSAWSVPHRGSYAQDSTPLRGPEPGTGTVHRHQALPGEIPVITQVSEPYPDGRRVVWSSTIGFPEDEKVRKFDLDTLAPLGAFDGRAAGDDPPPQPTTSGVYNVLGRGNVLYTVRGARIMAYTDAVPGDRRSPVRRVARFALPARALCGADDRVIGLTMSYGGDLLFVTVNGVVGAVPADPQRLDDRHVRVHAINGDRCATGDGTLERVNNSLAADEDGGVYVVTDQALHRFDVQADGPVVPRWRTAYETGSGASGAKLDAGSGSTPDVLGTHRGDDRLVAITDGRQLMHLVLMWRDRIPADWAGLPGRDRRVACEVPVTFGDPAATTSVSEQSVVTRGNAAYVVNNALALDPLLALLPDRQRPISAITGQLPGNAPKGVERIDWDPTTRTCRSVWANRDVSIPNGVPVLSVGSDLLYGIGVRSGVWGLEGLDERTGRSALWVPASADPTEDSFFAQTTVAPGGRVITGTLFGLSSYTRASPPPEPALECRDVEAPRVLRLRARARGGRLVVRGRASDTACGTTAAAPRVEVRVGRGPWRRARGGSSWTHTVRVRPGRHRLRVRPVDRDGNRGPTVLRVRRQRA